MTSLLLPAVANLAPADASGPTVSNRRSRRYRNPAVDTRNTTYEIIVMDRNRAEILVRGGRFFPVYSRAHLAGASLGGSFLKLHGIYVGFSMEIYGNDEPIITSAVRRISVVRDERQPS